MLEQALTYATPGENAGIASTRVRILGGSEFERRRIAEDCDASGLRVIGHGPLDTIRELLDPTGCGPLGDVVIADCTRIDVPALVMLARLDIAAARTGARLVVSTDFNGLDDVFGCLDQSGASILVLPSRAERMQALSSLRRQVAPSCVRELSDEDREAIAGLTRRIAAFSKDIGEPDGLRRADAPGGTALPMQIADESEVLRKVRPSLPDPRLVRTMIAQRQRRAAHFGTDMFADPAWDMLLDLTAARAEHKRVSVTSLCIASGVPPTTALRWIGQMIDGGLFERVADDSDKRRAFVRLTDRAAEQMAQYFAGLDASGAVPS